MTPFNEALHPRHPRGVREGGRFRDKAIVNERFVEEDIGKYVDDLTPYMTDPEDILSYTDYLRRRYREIYGPPLQDLTTRLHGFDAIIEPEAIPKILGDPSAVQNPTFSVALNTGRPDPPTFTVRYLTDGVDVTDVLDPTDPDAFDTLDEAVRYTKLVNAARGLSLRAAMFDELKHPRHPAGTEQGGEFAPKDAPHVGPVVDESGVEEKLRGEVQSLADYFADRPDYAYTPERVDQETQKLIAEYHRRFDGPQAELLKRLEGIPGVTIVPTVDAEKLAMYEGDSAEFMVRVDPGDPALLTPDVQVWNFPEEGGLQVAEALDLSDTDFFPADRPDLSGRYADVLDGIRGVKREGFVTLYRQMSDAEARAWEGGDEIPFGKWFARDRNANMGQDIAGEFTDTYTWRVARKDVVETDPGVFQLRRPAKLREDGTITASTYVEEQHPRDPGGEGGGQWIAKDALALDEVDFESASTPDETRDYEEFHGEEVVHSGYVIKGGRGYTIANIEVLVEEGVKNEKKLLDELDDAINHAPPALQENVTAIYIAAGENPNNAAIADKNGITGFEAYATANYRDGTIVVWNPGRIEEESMWHEMAHLVYDGGPPITSPGWPAVQGLDVPESKLALDTLKSAPEIPGHFVGDDAYSGPGPRYLYITPGRYQVTPYAATNIKEDWAESVMLFVSSRRNAGLVSYRDDDGFWKLMKFEDIWPNRARVIEEALGT